MTKKTIEIFVAMNEDGDWEARGDSTDAVEALIDNYGYTACRIVKMTLTLSAPEFAEVAANVPDEAGEIIQAEA